MSKYVIWDKQSDVITPNGKVFSPLQWVQLHPICGVSGVKTVLSGGVVNGAICMEFTSMVDMYKKEGCDFEGCSSDQSYLDAIEVYEEKRNEEVANIPTTEERIASALEAQVLMSLDDVEE